MRRNLLVILSLLFPTAAYANPVSFKDGWGIMPSYSTDYSDLEINYSLTNRYSLGVSVFYRDGTDHQATYTLGQFNWLVRRWNELDSQANVYVSVAAGERHNSDDGDSIAGYAAAQADYETRRVYTLLSGESLQSPGGVKFNRLRTRIGFSPYEAPIDAFQTWIIGQADYMPEMDHEVRFTPLLRFFYHNFALEAGSSLQGEVFLAGMAHF